MKIKLYRVVLNILFFIFYVLLASVAFSFIFPTILVILWQDVIAPNDPIFDSIQIAIIVLILFTSLIFRKFFFLPIREKIKIESNKKWEFKEYKKNENIKEEKKVVEEIIEDNNELDIKIGKEIK
jgi:hypothetical protein